MKSVAMSVGLLAIIVCYPMLTMAEDQEYCPLPDDPQLLTALVFRVVDADGNGAWSLQEFLAIQGTDAGLFRWVDANGNGGVELSEILPLVRAFGISPLDLLDTNGNRVIEYSEVSLYMTPEQFAVGDMDGNGVIDCRDLGIPPSVGPCPLPIIRLELVLRLAWPFIDADGNGLIRYEEASSILEGLAEWQFTMADLNADGSVSPRELLAIADAYNIVDLVPLLDANADRVIQYAEVEGYISETLFIAFDGNNNGVFDCSDWAEVLEMLPPPPFEGELPPPPEGEMVLPVEGEHVVLPCPLPPVTVEMAIERLWPVVDRNADGLLALEEVRRIYPGLTHDLFRAADLNGDGFVDRREALMAGSMFGIDDLVVLADANNDRLIQYEEVREYVSAEQFRLVDVNNNRVLDCEDLHVIPILPPPPPREGEMEPPVEGEWVAPPCPLPPVYMADLVERLWPLVDRSGDGLLAFEEVRALYPALDRSMFDLADLNRDGFIDRREALAVGSLLGGDDLVLLVDLNNDRLIQYEEVREYVSAEQFRLVDVNNNRVMDCEDLHVIPILPPPPPREGEMEPLVEGEWVAPPCPLPLITMADLVERVWYLVDRNGDGLLSFEEAAGVYPGLDRYSFGLADGDGDGYIDRDEAEAIGSLLGGAELVLLVDNNRDRLIQYEEVRGYVSAEQFRMADLNNNRVLDCEDWNGVSILPFPLPEEEGEDEYTEPLEEGEIPDVGDNEDGSPVDANEEPCPLPNVNSLVVNIVFLIVDINQDGIVTLEEIERIYPDIDQVVPEMYLGILENGIDRMFTLMILNMMGIDILSYVDTNGDRMIQHEEVGQYVGDDIFAMLDHNGNDVIDCVDYAYLTAPYTFSSETIDCGTGDLLTFVVQAAFLYIDENGDGIISFAEAELLLTENTGIVYSIIDRDQDGQITSTELLSLLLSIPINVIHILDANENASIDYVEVESFLPQDIFDELDANGDGSLNCDDFSPVPAEGEEPPVEGEEPPVEGEEPPVEGEDPPVEGEEPPLEGEEPPVEGEEPPVEGEEPPIEGEEPPAEGEEEGFEWPFSGDDLVSLELLQVLQGLFQQLDENNDQLLTMEEIQALLPIPQQVFDALDADGDHFLSWADMLAWQDAFASAPTGNIIQLFRTIIGRNTSNFFMPGEPLTIRLRIVKVGADIVNSLVLTELLPKGWTINPFFDKAGATAEFKSGVAANKLTLQWDETVQFPIEMEYQVIPSLDASGLLAFLGQLVYETGEGSETVGGLIPTVVVEALDALYAHTADTNADWRITLPELLRMIQLYNSGGYHPDPENQEDGYAPGLLEIAEGMFHAADTNADWRITLPELLRVIQLYNHTSRFYYVGNGTEDGYMPAPF